ncbi:MAG: FAD-dependent oxidoreductase [Tissierellia bacterium]|nr:FAD-dependent oxidoreductase [Tissierellia bacterium]
MDNNFRDLPKSYWLDSTPDTNYPSLENDIDVDIVIIGGGLTGLNTAYLLQKEKLKVAIIEAEKICKGTTAYTTAKITSQHGLIYSKIQGKFGEEMASLYGKSNENAIKMYEDIINENQIDCDFVSQSAFVFTQEDKYARKIKEEVEISQKLGIDAFYTDELPFPIDIKGAIGFNNQAQFHPRKYLLALANIIQNKVQIYENTRAVDIEEDNGYIITTEQGKKMKARKVIIASHYPFYNKKGMYFSKIFPKKSCIIGIKAEEKYPGGMYINAEKPTRSLRHQTTSDGELILVVGGYPSVGKREDTNKNYEALIEFAHSIFTVEDIPYRWSTQDYITLDEIPYIGYFTPDTPDMYIATGFQKWGMTNSMVSAMIIRDLIINGESPWQEVYDPSRKNIIASAKNFIVENLNVASSLLSGKLSPLPEDINLKPGEASVIKLDGDRIGAYRDEEGVLHFVNTTCTHMGCELNWNSAERTWDCPCHGSRFDIEGKIIQGPAVEPLKAGNNVNTIKKLLEEDF